MIMTADIRKLYQRRNQLEKFLSRFPYVTEEVIRYTDELQEIEIEIEARESIEQDSRDWD